MSGPRRRIASREGLERSLIHHVERFQLSHRLAPIPLFYQAATTSVTDALGAGGNLSLAELPPWPSR